MQKVDYKAEWLNYCKNELDLISPLVYKLGYNLDQKQPHLKGERYLMYSVTTKSGKKLILLAKRVADNLPVIIKITRDKKGSEEIDHERICREVLKKIDFAYDTFSPPKEIFYGKINGYTIFIQEFIPQEKTFLERTTEDQFFFALRALKAQESAHAATYENRKKIINSFGIFNSRKYLNKFDEFVKNISNYYKKDSRKLILLKRGRREIFKNIDTVEQYCNFLTHSDFVPHNFRIKNNIIYLLDYSSIRFGNKHEGWARFLNFMILHNEKLEEALIKYILDNRPEEEMISLKMMRIYRLGEIIWYYIEKLNKSSGNLLMLNKKRVDFWTAVLESILNERKLDEKIIYDYKNNREALRDQDEKERQIGLH